MEIKIDELPFYFEFDGEIYKIDKNVIDTVDNGGDFNLESISKAECKELFGDD